MGEVFRAVAVGAGGFEKPVVVKRILPQLAPSAQLGAMFAEEARLMSRLAHPNIVQVIDFGEGQGGEYFLVMELVDGLDLGRFRDSYALRALEVPVPLALHVAVHALRGLHHAHTRAYQDGRTLVHRDVSPGNVLLSLVGEVKVADFGVAWVAQPGGSGGDERLVGKPAFMAPEQYLGGAIDARADVFSLGVVLFELLTGELPFAGDDTERQRAAREGRRRSARALRPALREPLVAILDRALAPDPAGRFSTARAMAQAIEALEKDVVATSDALADAVGEARAALGASLAAPVLALSDDAGLAAGEAPRELTRHGPRGAFTLRVRADELSSVSTVRTVLEPAAPTAPALDGRASPTTATPRPRPRRALGLALVLGVLAVGVWLLSRPTRDDPAALPAVPAPSESTADAAARAAPTETAPPPRPPLSVALAASAPPRSASPRATTSVATAAPSAAVSAPSAAPPGCTGEVLLSARGSWLVTGGPARVEAPGIYLWPCGGYALTATARTDGRVLGASVVVREGRRASARFE
jgi:serine/threonine-protein kinase